MTKKERLLAKLKMLAEPSVYAGPVDDDLRELMLALELIEWLPPPAWQGNNHYGITQKGRDFLDANT